MVGVVDVLDGLGDIDRSNGLCKRLRRDSIARLQTLKVRKGQIVVPTILLKTLYCERIDKTGLSS